MSTIFDGTNIDLNMLKCTPIKPMPMGRVSNLITTLSSESLTIRTPSMATWGAKEVHEVLPGKTADGKPLTKGTGKWTLNLQFTKGEYKTEKETAFLEQLVALEHKLLELAKEKSQDWFGKQLSMDVIEEKIYPMLKYPKDPVTQLPLKTSPPFLSLKLPCWKGVWQTSVFDAEKNPLYVKGESPDHVSPLDFLTNDSKIPFHATCLIQCGGIWFTGGRVSITWNLKQIMVQKPEINSISDSICVLSLDDKLSTSTAAVEKVVEKPITEVDDDYDDNDSRGKPEETQIEEEQPSEPVITAPKKRGAKKV